MKWKKIIISILVFFVVASVVLSYLANRDLNKMYGGHTQVVDASQFDFPAENYVITNVNALSSDGESFIPHQNVYVKDEIIQLVDSTSSYPSDIKIIDGSDQYLIPGLIDAHIHLFNSENDLLLYVANGVTQIRELIGREHHLKWREEIRNGRIGPDMQIASPRVGSFGKVEGFFMEWSQWFKNINTTEEAKAYAQELKEDGYDAIKIYSHLNKESYEALSEEGAKLGLDIVGHIPWSLSYDDVFVSNQSDIVHFEEVMNAFRREYGHFEGEEGAAEFLSYIKKRCREITPSLLEKDIAVTSTLWLVESFYRQKYELDKILSEVELEYENPGISEWVDYLPMPGLGWLPDVNRYKNPEEVTEEETEGQRIFWETYVEGCRLVGKTLSEGGVTILAGTDANLPVTVPGFSLHDELISLQNAGMTPAQVLRSTTTLPAKRLRTNAGILQSGKDANMVLLSKNPLENIANTKSINQVFLQGKTISRVQLDNLLRAVKDANDASRTKDISMYR